MRDQIHVEFVDQVHMRIVSEEKRIHDEISEAFRFRMKNFEFMQRSMGFRWDGFIRLYKKREKLLPRGLLHRLKEFASKEGFDLTTDSRLENIGIPPTEEKIIEFIESLDIPFEVRDYQLDGIIKAIQSKRLVIESPTSSGKSFILYVIVMWILKCIKKSEKIVIVVPTVTLLYQLEDNFKEYGYKGTLHLMKAGAEDESKSQIYISTFQSLHRKWERREENKLDRRKKAKDFNGPDRRKRKSLRRKKVQARNRNYFKKFRSILIDEAHGIRASTDGRMLNDICELCTDADFRIAVSGTFSDESVDERVIEGYFSIFYKLISTNDLISRGDAAKLKIKVIKIRYPINITRQLNALDFKEQLDFQESFDNPRQMLIIELANSLKNNTIVLFRIHEHGKFMYDLIQSGHKETFYIDGDTPGPDRLEIFKRMEEEGNMTLVASYAVCSQGVNVKNLHNVIFATSYKSKIRILQSIGRVLRLHGEKDYATLYDVTDEFRYPLRHYEERKGYYAKEQFPVEEREVDIESWVKQNADVIQRSQPHIDRYTKLHEINEEKKREKLRRSSEALDEGV